MELLKFLMICRPFNPKSIEWLLSSMISKFNCNDDFARNLWIGFTSVAFLKESNTKNLQALTEKFTDVIMAPHVQYANRGSMRFSEAKVWNKQNFCVEILENIEFIKLSTLDNLKSWIESYYKELQGKLRIQFDFSGLLKQFLLYSNNVKVVAKIVEIFELLRNLDNPTVFDHQVEEILMSKATVFENYHHRETPKNSTKPMPSFKAISHSTFEDTNPVRREQPLEIFSNAVKQRPKINPLENNIYKRSNSMTVNQTKNSNPNDDDDDLETHQRKEFLYIESWLSKSKLDQVPRVEEDEMVMMNLSNIEHFENFCCFIFEPLLHPLSKNWSEQHQNLPAEDKIEHLLAIRSFKTMQTLSDKRNLLEIAKGNKEFFEIYFRLMYNSLSVKQNKKCNLNHIGALTESLVRFEPEISVGYILHYNLFPRFFHYLDSASIQNLLLTLFKCSKFGGDILERTYRKLIKYCESSFLFPDLARAVLEGNQAFEVQKLHVEKPVDLKDSFLFTSIVQQDIQLIRQPSLQNYDKLQKTFLYEDLNHYKLDIDSIKPSLEERKEILKKNLFENLFNSFVTTVNHDFASQNAPQEIYQDENYDGKLHHRSKSERTNHLPTEKLPKILAAEKNLDLSNRVLSEISINRIENLPQIKSNLKRVSLTNNSIIKKVDKSMKENAPPNPQTAKKSTIPHLFPRRQTKGKNLRPIQRTTHKEFDNTTFFNEQQKQELDKLYPTSYKMKSPVEKEAAEDTFVLQKLLANDKFCLDVCEFLDILIRKSLPVKTDAHKAKDSLTLNKKKEILNEKYILNKNIGVSDVDFTAFWKAFFSKNGAAFENLLKNYLFKIKLHCVQEINSGFISGEIINLILHECLKGNPYLQPWANQIRELCQKYFGLLSKTLIHSHAWIFKNQSDNSEYKLSSAHILLVKTISLMIQNNPENNHRIINYMDETCWHVLINWFSHNRTNNIYQEIFFKITQTALLRKDENFMLSFFFKLGFIPSLYKIWSEIYQNGVFRQDLDISSIYLYLKKITHLIDSIETTITDQSNILKRELKRSRIWEILKCYLLLQSIH